jgi:membrane protein implicated in regulation of membrane protease activity
MKLRNLLILIATILCLPALALAAEAAPALTPADGWSYWLDKVVAAALPVLGAIAVYYLHRKAKTEDQRVAMTEVVNALTVGVRQTYQAYVRERKRGRMDGKLTDDERATARKIAYNRALDVLKEMKSPGLKLLESMAWPMVSTWISKLVNREKIEGNAAKGSLTVSTVTGLPAADPQTPAQ